MKSLNVHGAARLLLVLVGVALISGCSEGSDGSGAGSGGSGSPSGGSAGMAGSSSGAAGGGSGGAAGTSGTAGSAAGGGAGMPNDGICRPVLVQPASNPNAVELVRAESSPIGGISAPNVVGDMILYRGPEGLSRIPKAGGTPELLYPTTEFPGFNIANGLVYFIWEGALQSVSATAPTTTPTTVVPTVEYSGATDGVIGVDATNLYLSVRASNEIRAIELATGTITPLLTGVENQDWLLTNGFIYFVGPNDDIQRISVAGGAPETIHNASNILTGIGVDGDELYYGGIGYLRRVTPSEMTLLAWDTGSITRIRPVGSRVVFSSSNGGLGWVMKEASSCQGLAESRFNLGGWDVDDSNVYVAAEDVLYRIPL